MSRKARGLARESERSSETRAIREQRESSSRVVDLIDLKLPAAFAAAAAAATKTKATAAPATTTRRLALFGSQQASHLPLWPPLEAAGASTLFNIQILFCRQAAAVDRAAEEAAAAKEAADFLSAAIAFSPLDATRNSQLARAS